MTATQVKARVLKSRRIYEWDELCQACEAKVRRDGVSENDPIGRALASYDKSGWHAAQLTPRVIAVAARTQPYIDLGYLSSEGSLQIGRVRVYPAAGGWTQYCCGTGASGYLLNKHTPVSARDLPNRSYVHWIWSHGTGGVYQRGVGPYFPDAGPDFLARTASQVAPKIMADSECGSDAWRAAAIATAAEIEQRLTPFPDARVRFEVYRDKDGDVRVQGAHKSGTIEMYTSALLRCRVKFPHDDDAHERHDVVITVLQRPTSLPEFMSPEVLYCLESMSPTGRGTTRWAYSPPSGWTGLPWSDSPAAFIDFAVEAAAQCIFIPA